MREIRSLGRMSVSNLDISKSNSSEQTLDNMSKPISSGTLRSKSLPSNVHSPSEQNQNRKDLSGLLKSSLDLQNEINGIFEELCTVNRQVRVDIDDFCHIRDNSTTQVNNVSQAD